MEIELLNRKKWKTRIELANAIFDYIEIFHNRQRSTPPSATAPQSNMNLRPHQHPSPPDDSHTSG